MQERESNERCDGCPFKFLPTDDPKVWETIDLYHELSTPLGSQMADSIIKAYRPKLTRLDYIELVKALNQVYISYQEQLSKEYKSQKIGDAL